MTPWRSELHACLRLARVSNLPTCWTNVLVGAALGAPGAPPAWRSVGAAMLAVSLFYIAGMALNDVVDAAVDRHERPDRPIPSGAIPLRQATWFILISFGIGMALFTWLSAISAAFGAALAVCIIAYDYLHKRWVGAVILMGACRGLIYLIAAGAVSHHLDWRLLWPMAFILTTYTIAITLVARIETTDHIDARRWLAIAMPFVVPAAAWILTPTRWLRPIVFGVVTVGWLAWTAWQVFRSPPRIMQAVPAWLAGMCLLDAYILALLNQPVPAGLALACFVLTRLGQRRIAGT